MATLAVKVDPAGALGGAKVVKHSMEEMEAAAKKVEAGTNRVRDAMGRFVKSGSSASQAADRMGKSLMGANDNFKRLSHEAGVATASFGHFNSIARSATTQLVAMAAATIGFRAIATTLSGFEQSMAQVAAISRANTTELAAMRDMAKELGATTEFTTAQAADGLRFLSMAGFDAQRSLAAMPAVLDLATATFMELDRAADIASNIMSAFGIAASDASQVADVLSAAAARANTDIYQMGDAMKYAGPVASALGISMNDAAAAIGTLSDAGIQGSMAGTSLRRILSSLSNPVGDTAKVIKALGLSLDELNPKTTSIVTIIEKLRKAGLQASEAFRIFGDRGAPAILALIENEPKLRSLTKTLEDVEGEAARMAKTMRDNLWGDFKNLEAAAESLVIALGEAGITSALRTAAQAVTSLVRVLADNADGLLAVLTALAAAHIGRVVAGLAAMTAGMGAATVAARVLTLALAALGGPVGIGVMVTSLAASFLLLRDNMSAADKAARDAVSAYQVNEKALNDSETASRGYSQALRDQIAMQVEAAKAAYALADANFIAASARRTGFEAMTGIKFAPLTYAEDVAYKEAEALNVALAKLEDQLAAVDANMSVSKDTTDQTTRALGELDKAAEKAAKAYKRIVDRAQDFVRSQQLEASVLGLTELEANKLRYTHDLLAEAQRAGIELTPKQRAELIGLGHAMAEAEERTRFLTEAFDFTKSTIKGFFSDLRSGLEEGKGFWEAFADAGTKALQKIADKLLDMALDQMINNLLRSLMGTFNLGGGMGGGFGNTSYFPPAPSGGFHMLADGGFVSGPGTATSDSIPAWLSDGEFVVRAAAVAQPGMLPMLEAINSGDFAARMALGGLARVHAPANSGVQCYSGGGLARSQPVSHGNAALNLQVDIQNNTNAQVEVGEPQQGPDGSLILPMLIREVKKEVASDIAGNGQIGRTIQGTFGINRRTR